MRRTTAAGRRRSTSARLSRLQTPSRSRLARARSARRSGEAASCAYRTPPPSACASARTPCAAAVRASAAVEAPLPRRITSGSTAGSETSASAPACSAVRTRPTAAASAPAVCERRPQHPVDEHRDRAERGGAGAEHDGVAALQHLRRHVDGNVRPRLEVGADDADRDQPLGDLEPVGQPPRAQLAGDRRERRGRADARRDRLQPAVVELQPVERAGVELSLGRFEVELVRGEDLGAPLGEQLERADEGQVDTLVRERCECAARAERLALDELEDRSGDGPVHDPHFIAGSGAGRGRKRRHRAESGARRRRAGRRASRRGRRPG